jgi:hypothetical protein
MSAGMAMRETQYRGYNIELDRRGREFHISITPSCPELPVLRRRSFRALVPSWEGALEEAKRQIDQALSK